MASSMQYYTITITNSISNSSPSDGFVDHKRIESYLASTSYALELNSTTTLTLSHTTAKRRGNMRYHEIIRQLQLVSNMWIDPNTLTATGGTTKLEPSAFSFQMVGLFGDAAWVTANELGGTNLTSTACITRCIARALCLDFFTETEIFDPTATTSAGNSTSSIIRYGSRINVAGSFEVGAYSTGIPSSSIPAAEAVIAVVKLH